MQELLIIDKPRTFLNEDEAEEGLRSFTPDYWLCSKWRRLGWSTKRIYDKFAGKYSEREIEYMIEAVLNVNMCLTMKNGDQLRQQMIDELQEQKSRIYDSCPYTEEGEPILSTNQHRLIISIQDRLIALSGINAPIRTESVSLSVRVDEAKETISQKMARYIGSVKGEGKK